MGKVRRARRRLARVLCFLAAGLAPVRMGTARFLEKLCCSWYVSVCVCRPGRGSGGRQWARRRAVFSRPSGRLPPPQAAGSAPNGCLCLLLLLRRLRLLQLRLLLRRRAGRGVVRQAKGRGWRSQLRSRGGGRRRLHVARQPAKPCNELARLQRSGSGGHGRQLALLAGCHDGDGGAGHGGACRRGKREGTWGSAPRSAPAHGAPSRH